MLVMGNRAGEDVFGRQATAVDAQAGTLESQLTDFFGEHYDRLVRLAALVCQSTSTVEDAVQAAMERAWRDRNKLRDATRLRPWLDQIVVREAIRTNRRPWWARLPLASDDEAAQLPARRAVVTDASWMSLVGAFRRLPPEQRVAVALHLYAGYPVDETARLMSTSLETTRSRLRLARQRLRRDIGEDEDR